MNLNRKPLNPNPKTLNPSILLLQLWCRPIFLKISEDGGLRDSQRSGGQNPIQGYGFIWGLYQPPVMENHMEKKIENDMGTGIIEGINRRDQRGYNLIS